MGVVEAITAVVMVGITLALAEAGVLVGTLIIVGLAALAVGMGIS